MRFRFPFFSSDSGARPESGAAYEPVSTARAVVNGDGAILIDSEQGIMFSLNPTGGLIWSGLTEKLPTTAISRRLSEECGVPERQADQDVTEFLSILEKNRLVRRVCEGR